MATPPPNLFTGNEYNPDQDREKVRSGVTWTFIILFSVIILTYMGAALLVPSPSEQWARFKEVMEVVLPAVTGTLGTALGFYFGSRSKRDL